MSKCYSIAVVVGLGILVGCSADGSDVIAPTTIAETPITIPTGVLAAIPIQNRLDVAKGIFQVQLINGTSEFLDVVAVQFVWDGLTTPLAQRENRLEAGARIDYPVSLAPANCLGDGTQATMPDPISAIVKVTVRDGRIINLPVYDVKHFARKLYLDDCERQYISAEVEIQFADLHGATLEGRPVTEGVLRVMRRESSNSVVVKFVSNTINFTFVPINDSESPVVTLPADKLVAEVPIRFIEGRCDAHALSESSQPFKFYAVLDLGDGIERSFAMTPEIGDQIPMRHRVEAACEILDKIGFVGE